MLERFPGRELLGTAYEPPFRFIAGPELRRPRPHRAGGRLRHDRRRHRHRPHRARLRRGRHAPRRGERPARRQPGRTDGTYDERIGALRGALRQGRRPGHHRRPQGARPASPRRALRAQLPVLLALRHAAALLRQGELVHPHDRAPRRAARRQRVDRVAPVPHQARALRRVAREQRRLGAHPRPLLGHAAARLALRGGAHALRRLDRRAARAGAAPCPRTCTGPTSTTSPSPAPSAAARCAACRR